MARALIGVITLARFHSDPQMAAANSKRFIRSQIYSRIFEYISFLCEACVLLMQLRSVRDCCAEGNLRRNQFIMIPNKGENSSLSSCISWHILDWSHQQ